MLLSTAVSTHVVPLSTLYDTEVMYGELTVAVNVPLSSASKVRYCVLQSGAVTVMVTVAVSVNVSPSTV